MATICKRRPCISMRPIIGRRKYRRQEEAAACRARARSCGGVCRAPRTAACGEVRRRVLERPPGSQRESRRIVEGHGAVAVIVADTGAILALVDKGDRHHNAVRELYDERPESLAVAVGDSAGGRLPRWAPTVGHPRPGGVSRGCCRGFIYRRERQARGYRSRPARSARKYRTLGLGLVDAVVIAIAERVRAEAIATLDLRHFGAVKIAGSPPLFPRDAR